VTKFCIFFGKTTPYDKIFNILFQKFSPPHRLTSLCSNVKFVRRENRRNRALFTSQKTISAASQTVATMWISPQNLPGLAFNIWLTLFQISSKSVHFRRSYSRTRQHRSFAPFSISNICLQAAVGIVVVVKYVISNTLFREIYSFARLAAQHNHGRILNLP